MNTKLMVVALLIMLGMGVQASDPIVDKLRSFDNLYRFYKSTGFFARVLKCKFDLDCHSLEKERKFHYGDCLFAPHKHKDMAKILDENFEGTIHHSAYDVVEKARKSWDYADWDFEVNRKGTQPVTIKTTIMNNRNANGTLVISNEAFNPEKRGLQVTAGKKGINGGYTVVTEGKYTKCVAKTSDFGSVYRYDCITTIPFEEFVKQFSK